MIFINIRVKNLTLHEKNAESYRNCTKLMQNFAKLARKRCNLSVSDEREKLKVNSEKSMCLVDSCRKHYVGI